MNNDFKPGDIVYMAGEFRATFKQYVGADLCLVLVDGATKQTTWLTQYLSRENTVNAYKPVPTSAPVAMSDYVVASRSRDVYNLAMKEALRALVTYDVGNLDIPDMIAKQCHSFAEKFEAQIIELEEQKS
jgi:hypothetical protein